MQADPVTTRQARCGNGVVGRALVVGQPASGAS